jgi:hypothetical protein
MTTEQVLLRVKLIQQSAGDDEYAHSMEDDLRRDVLQAIADGAPNVRELAAAALKTDEINFARWCA